MKQVKFSDLPNFIKGLTFDGDINDLRLHADEQFNWGAETKKEYNEATKAIDAISYKGNGWELYAWYDVSSFEYWMMNQQEQNYIQISILFDKPTVNEDEVSLIYKALDSALADADALENKYSFNPSTY